MRSEDVKEVLKPLYEAYEKHCHSGDIDKCVEFYHADGVMVEKGKGAVYGKSYIRDALVKLWEQTGPQKFTKFNEKYEGCDDFLILTCDNTMDSVKRGKETAKIVQIWKKDHGKWTIYHEECDVKK
ncbi:hypothetical protein RB195_004066 [Necator americanus]|uniref:DUF4440 domain-containing protein n=1 Tax=Necator americanus TaxID=51031 RepID=A0ABR1BJS4_NECAM